MTFIHTNTCQTGFEGPEKKLEVLFKSINGKKTGLREVTQERWQEILDHAKCTIISTTKNDFFDSFVLSESSLFVYPNKVLLKTCGTTTLLHCISALQELARDYGTEIEMIIYSRKNYNFPTKQQYPHVHFDDEVHFLNKLFKGEGYVLGPLNRDHWSVYIADFRSVNLIESASNQVFEIMMHDLDTEKMAQFFQKDGVTARMTTHSSGISGLLPGSLIDDYQFEPCGYSMNGLLKEWYWTIHITPESHCSYVSFETNAPLDSYNRLLRKVISLFLPGRATIAVRADENAPCGDPVHTFDTSIVGYTSVSHTLRTLPGSMSVVVCNLVQQEKRLEG